MQEKYGMMLKDFNCIDENMRNWILPGRTKPYVMAHRGDSVYCPENTLAAFRKAIADGADILETDLHLSRDGEMMCIHDASVDRTTDGRGLVAEMSAGELRSLNAGVHFPAFQEERIPTLAELIAILPENVALALELKTDRFLEAGVCQHLVEILDQSGLRTRTVVISFNLARLKTLQKVAPDLPVGLITMNRLFTSLQTQFIGPFWIWLFINPFFVWQAHLFGQWVCPLDMQPLLRLRFYCWLGCDVILSNHPAEIMRALNRSPESIKEV
jgi:glycerophosphoryl diester phosphodiesterase